MTDPDLAISPGLATLGVWNPAADEFTLTLRQGVKFHDGADFNADAVNFTWDRLNFLMNITGTNDVEVTQIAGLYMFPDGTPIVSSITKNSEYSVTFNLARPFIPFKALLCFSGSYMMSPDSTPAEAYIDTATGDIVGTGAFVYDGYEAGVEVLFHAYADYWQGASEIDNLTFSIINDANARNAALLSGSIHFLPDPMVSMIDVFNTTEGIVLEEGPQSVITQYLGMNNRLINNTWREAISTALDYDYILDVLRDGNAVRLESPIPLGISMANWTHQEDLYNLTHARLVMQSMGFGLALNVTPGSTDEGAWAVAGFRTLNYTYNIGNSFREDILVLLQDNLGKIGITVEDAGMIWDEFVWRLNGAKGRSRNDLQLFWVGWGPDYNDPANFIDPLFTNSTGPSSNGAQYNGYTAAIEAGRDPLALMDNVQLLMEAGLSEPDPVAREALYDRIQELLIEEDRPWAWGYISDYNYIAYDNDLTGFQPNALKKLYFYSCVWNKSIPILPGLFSILSDADDPDFDGDFSVTWSPSAYADNYSLYVYSSLITEINSSLTLLLDEVTDLSYEASGYSNGTYYFLVVAKNGNGNTNSSNLIVNVKTADLPSPFTLFSDAESPDANGDFNLGWTPSAFADNYTLYVYSSLITEINGSLTLLLDEVTVTSFEALNYSDGTYFFAVVAKNTIGTRISNNIEVIVETYDLPSPFTLFSDAGSPDTNGDFNLAWILSTFADNYSLYVYSSLITEINGSLTLLLDEVTITSYEALDYSDGTYFFAVVAKNAYGTTLSNNLKVIVGVEEPEPEPEPEPTPEIPGFELWTMFFTISSVGLILLLRKKKKIT